MKFYWFKLCTKNIDVVDHVATGWKMKRLRVTMKASLNDMAIFVGKSPQYLCDLEKGDRKWKQEFCDAYQKYYQEVYNESGD